MTASLVAAGRALLVLALVAALAACNRTDPERELRTTIDAMAASIESHAVATFLDHLADDFTRESDTFGKRDAQRLLAGVLLRNEKIHVAAVVNSLVITGATARTKLRVVATGGSGLLPERGQTWEFDVSWRREKGAWRAYNAEWREGL